MRCFGEEEVVISNRFHTEITRFPFHSRRLRVLSRPTLEPWRVFQTTVLHLLIASGQGLVELQYIPS